MTTHSIRTLLAATLALLPACDPDDLDHTAWDEVEFRCNPLFSTCAPTNNTPFTGALNLSPLDTTGATFQNIRVDKAELAGGLVLDEFWAFEGQLFGRKGTLIYSGTDFINARFSLTAWGDPISLLVTAVTPPPPAMPGESFWLYLFTWDNGLGGTTPACLPTEPGGDLRAIVHDDLVIDGATGVASTRPDTVYIACLRGAAGEVAYGPLGYGFRPFEIGTYAFTAAMRFLRADYCGDGTTWTKYGQPISYSDKWSIGGGVQLGHTDAVWGMSGALCIGEALRAGHVYADITCSSGVVPPKCGDEDDAKARYLAEGRFWTALP